MPLYALTIFLSAFLLFLVQPVIAKHILPWFGGSAAVWTTCMLFFQSILLAGYAYADFTTRRLKPKTQAYLHIFLLVVSLASLPILPGDMWKPASGAEPISRILLLLLATIGLPYFLLSTTGPLVQAWFARSFPSSTVYRLFALSNFASLLALVAYPLVIEPFVAGRVQSWGWSAGYAGFVMACGAAAWFSLKHASSDTIAAHAVSDEEPSAPPTTTDLTIWLTLAALGSLFLLTITTHITQNVASVPFLWIVPLILYLLSFILCFDGKWYQRKFFLGPLFVILPIMAWGLTFERGVWTIEEAVPVYCVGLFVVCMFCHGELAALKPAPRYLTRFYLMISVGGALGGFLVGVLAPLVFPSYYEFPLALVLCGVMAIVLTRKSMGDLTIPAPMLIPLVAIPMGLYLFTRFESGEGLKQVQPGNPELVVSGIVAVILIVMVLRRVNLRVGVVVPLFATAVTAAVSFYGVKFVQFLQDDTSAMARNFYGTLRVKSSGDEAESRTMRKLVHGVIKHGEQFTAPTERARITSYYGEVSGIGAALNFYDRPGAKRRVGVIGLGVGTLVGYGGPEDTFKLYELNPQVLDYAKSHFWYLNASKAKLDAVLGDARLSLEREAPNQFDVLAIDAFSSDSIPVHLVTREAMQVYLRHMKPDGVMAFHVTNRYLRLAPVVKQLADEIGMQSVLVTHDPETEDWHLSKTDWVLVTNNKALLASEGVVKQKAEIREIPGLRVWTDDFNNLLSILK